MPQRRTGHRGKGSTRRRSSLVVLILAKTRFAIGKLKLKCWELIHVFAHFVGIGMIHPEPISGTQDIEPVLSLGLKDNAAMDRPLSDRLLGLGTDRNELVFSAVPAKALSLPRARVGAHSSSYAGLCLCVHLRSELLQRRANQSDSESPSVGQPVPSSQGLDQSRVEPAFSALSVTRQKLSMNSK